MGVVIVAYVQQSAHRASFSTRQQCCVIVLRVVYARMRRRTARQAVPRRGLATCAAVVDHETQSLHDIASSQPLYPV